MENLISQLPSLTEAFFNPIAYVVYAIYSAYMVWETIFPARKLSRIKFLKGRGIIAFITFFLLSTYLPIFWVGFHADYQIFDLTRLGTIGGAVIGIFIYEFSEYIWHRTMYSSNFLWKVSNQMHHSAERLDSFGAYYFSPIFWEG